jgi:hypothetical protein
MLQRFVCLAGAGILSATSSFAQHQPVENGMPCVAQLCVDDELSSVLDLPWIDVAPRASRDPDAQVQDVLRADADVLRAVGSYWHEHVFDANGLRALSRVQAVCREIGVRERPSADFLAADGRRATVTFEPEPDARGKGVVFRVAEIVLRTPEGSSTETMGAYRLEAQRLYADLSNYATTTQPGAQWHQTPQGGELILMAAVGDPQKRAAELGQQPLCRPD